MLASLRCVAQVLTAPFDGQGGQGTARRNAWQSLLSCAASRAEEDQPGDDAEEPRPAASA